MSRSRMLPSPVRTLIGRVRRSLFSVLPAAALTAMVCQTPTMAVAQWGNCATCAPQPACASCQPVAQQVVQAAPVACAQPVTVQVPPTPVMQTCYQTVPVTTYKREEVTVQKPVWDVEYVEQPVTEYRPVSEVKTASVPQTTYQNVTEYRTVTQNRGYWQTYYRPNPKVAPCQYDCRPGFVGWLNRTSYSMRSNFTPDYVPCRRYVPNTCTRTVPITRRVPQTTYRQVNYTVTKMVPYQTTKRVAVRKLRYEQQKVVAMKPVTSYRTVPTGSTVAYVGGGTTTAYYGSGTTTAYWGGFGAPATAYYLPSDGSTSRTADADGEKFNRSARGPKPDPISNERRRTANSKDDIEKEPFRRDTSLLNQRSDSNRSRGYSASDLNMAALQARRAARRRAATERGTIDSQNIAQADANRTAKPTGSIVPTSRGSRPSIVASRSTRASLPTIVRANHWTPRHARQTVAVGPQLTSPSLAAADTNR